MSSTGEPAVPEPHFSDDWSEEDEREASEWSWSRFRAMESQDLDDWTEEEMRAFGERSLASFYQREDGATAEEGR